MAMILEYSEPDMGLSIIKTGPGCLNILRDVILHSVLKNFMLMHYQKY